MRTIPQIRRALSSLAFNLTDLEEFVDIEKVDSHVDSLETLVEDAEERKSEEDSDSDDDEEEESSSDE